MQILDSEGTYQCNTPLLLSAKNKFKALGQAVLSDGDTLGAAIEIETGLATLDLIKKTANCILALCQRVGRSSNIHKLNPKGPPEPQ